MRTATPLNIETQPGVGMGYVVRNIKTKKLVRVSTTCQRDIDRRGSKIKVLRAFSGDEPFFTAKIGSLHTEIEVLKFLCGVKHKKCRDTTDTYEWTGITLAEAREQGLEFSEPGYVTKEDAAPKSTKKVKKTKKVKTAKVAGRGRPKGSKNKVKVDAPAADATQVQTPDAPVAPVEAAVAEPVAAVKPEQTDAEFEAEINEQFEKDLAKTGAPAVTA